MSTSTDNDMLARIRATSTDEQVLKVVTTHWTSMVPAGAFAIGLIAAPWAVRRFTPWDAQAGYVMLLSLLGLLCLVILVVLQWRSPPLVVTSQKLLRKQGIGTRSLRDIPLQQITNVTATQGPLEHLLRIGTLRIDIGGSVGPTLLGGLTHPHDLERLILDTMHQRELDLIQAGMSMGGSATTGSGTNPQLSNIEHISDELRRLRQMLSEELITQNQFEEAKHSLLRRI